MNADVTEVMRKATIRAHREGRKKVGMRHVLQELLELKEDVAVKALSNITSLSALAFDLTLDAPQEHRDVRVESPLPYEDNLRLTLTKASFVARTVTGRPGKIEPRHLLVSLAMAPGSEATRALHRNGVYYDKLNVEITKLLKGSVV